MMLTAPGRAPFSEAASHPAVTCTDADRDGFEVPVAPASEAVLASSWLLDPKQRIIGYRMAWRSCAGQPGRDAAAQLQGLVRAIADSCVDPDGGWRLGEASVLLDVTPEALHGIDWHGIACGNIVLCWQPEHVADSQLRPLLESLRAQGFGLMLSGVMHDAGLRRLASHLDVGPADPLLVATARSADGKPVPLVASRIGQWSDLEVCAAQCLSVLVSPALEAPRAASQPRRTPQPGTLLIVRLLQMVQRNEDIRQLEAALKHDATLTYRLLRYINSPGISAGVQIESVRHAISMLGYSRLFRWLSLLLAASSSKTTPPFLMKKAIMRGRFVELAGQALLGPRHSDNLFLVGMFSAMDQLLGIALPELLEKVQLAASIQAAILERQGVYGPFLSLALSCEAGADDVDRLAEELFMSASQVNSAQLQAICWCQQISRDAPG